MNFFSIAAAVLLTASVTSSYAEETHSKRIEFPKGKSHTMVTGQVVGRGIIVYTLKAKAGQFLKLNLETDKQSNDFNLYVPGRGPGDEALYTSAIEGRSFTGQLDTTGDHTITVFLNRNAARKGITANYKLHVSISSKPPSAPKEEKPSTGPVPQRVIDDCLAALRKQVPGRDMKVMSSKRGETSFIVEVKVDGVPKPWRCFHDGTKCTGTQYQGEG